MIWILCCIYGSIWLAVVNAFFRKNPYDWPFMWLLLAMVIPTTLGTQLGFGLCYKLGPSFSTVWFVGAGMTAITGFLTSLFIFREQVDFMNILAILLIMGGQWLLIR